MINTKSQTSTKPINLSFYPLLSTWLICLLMYKLGTYASRGASLHWAYILLQCSWSNSFGCGGTVQVFADHASSLQPMLVPRTLLWNLRRRFVFFGTSVTSIFRGMLLLIKSQLQLSPTLRNYVCLISGSTKETFNLLTVNGVAIGKMCRNDSSRDSSVFLERYVRHLPIFSSGCVDQEL